MLTFVREMLHVHNFLFVPFFSFTLSCILLQVIMNLVAGLQTFQLFTVTEDKHYSKIEKKKRRHNTPSHCSLCCSHQQERRQATSWKSGEPSSFSSSIFLLLILRHGKVCFHDNERIKGKGAPSQNDTSDLGACEKINHPGWIDRGKRIGFPECEPQKKPAMMDLVCLLIPLLLLLLQRVTLIKKSTTT